MGDLKIIAGVVIEQDGKILLVQEKKEKVRGLWNFPAGHVQEGETEEAAAIREAKEEVNLDVALIEKLGVFTNEKDPKPKHAFKAEVIGGELQIPKEELLDAQWFTPEEINAMSGQLRDPWISEAVAELRKKIIDATTEGGYGKRL